MAKRIFQSIQNWRYLGYDRDTLRRYGAEMDRANLRTTQRMCLLALALTALLFVFYGPFLLSSNRMGTAAAFALFVIIIYLVIGRILSNQMLYPLNHVKTLVFLISAVMYLCGIYSGTQLSNGELGVLSVWMFLLVQISFDIPPLQNMITVFLFAGLFLLIDRQVKTPERWQRDVIYTYISVFVGLFISYHQSRLALDNIIAKSNLQKTNFALYHTATTDELTGLMNRRMLFDRYETILSDCVATKCSIACVILDIDDYKQYNDSYGHPEGDALLRRIGELLCSYSNETGIDIGRIGGEEFLAVWQEKSVSHCEQVAEELRRAIEQMAIPHIGSTDHDRVTMSVGLCMLPYDKAQGAYLYADKALYRAKEAGKNCSCYFDEKTGQYRVPCEMKQPS
ncbi:MAG: GGDEF domain-containing protein [Eubacteriales bacterium]|nr:GGDEF domain-containing protein [Eubacteriales bacterium]